MHREQEEAEKLREEALISEEKEMKDQDKSGKKQRKVKRVHVGDEDDEDVTDLYDLEHYESDKEEEGKGLLLISADQLNC